MTEQQTQEQDTQAQDQGTSDGTQNTDGQQTDQGYRSQDDFDKAFARKLEKEREKLRKELATEAEAAKKKAAMDEATRLKTEMEERDHKANEREKAANQRAVRSEAKVQALDAGANPKRVTAVLDLARKALSEVEVDDDGEPDVKAVRKAIEATLKEYPEFKSGASIGGAGSNPAGGDSDGNDPAKNPWSKEHFNLTEQGNIMRADPAKAERLRKAAQG